MPHGRPVVLLKLVQRQEIGLEPAARVAEVVLRDRQHLWPLTCLALQHPLSFDKYRRMRALGWPSAFATDLQGTLLGEFTEGMDALHRSSDQELINRRRAKVLELLAASVVLDKYAPSNDHQKSAGDTEVLINGVRQTPGLLDVCFWASCCAKGEFYDCKANVSHAHSLEPKVKLLSNVYHGLYDPEAKDQSHVGVISFADADYARAQVDSCRGSNVVEVYGEQTFLTDLPSIRACDCT